jgi:hypothetical protein
VWQELGRLGHVRKTPREIDSSRQRRRHEGITAVPRLAGCLAMLRSYSWKSLEGSMKGTLACASAAPARARTPVRGG